MIVQSSWASVALPLVPHAIAIDGDVAVVCYLDAAVDIHDWRTGGRARIIADPGVDGHPVMRPYLHGDELLIWRAPEQVLFEHRVARRCR